MLRVDVVPASVSRLRAFLVLIADSKVEVSKMSDVFSVGDKVKWKWGSRLGTR